jgi:hypothetical protein
MNRAEEAAGAGSDKLVALRRFSGALPHTIPAVDAAGRLGEGLAEIVLEQLWLGTP